MYRKNLCKKLIIIEISKFNIFYFINNSLNHYKYYICLLSLLLVYSEILFWMINQKPNPVIKIG